MPEQLTSRHLHNIIELWKQAHEQIAIEARMRFKLWGIKLYAKCY